MPKLLRRALGPSRRPAAVRLGLTPSRLKHRPQALVREVLRTLP